MYNLRTYGRWRLDTSDYYIYIHLDRSAARLFTAYIMYLIQDSSALNGYNSL